MRVMIMVVMRYVGSLGYHRCRYSQSRRVVVFIPLTDVPNNRHNKNSEYQDEYQRKHYAEHPEAESQSHIICLSALYAVQCNSKYAPDQAVRSTCVHCACV